MAEIHFTLPEPLNEYVQAQIAGGRYTSVQEYLHDLVDADLRQQQLLGRLQENERLAAHLDHGLASGAGRYWTADVLEELKQRIGDPRQDAPAG